MTVEKDLFTLYDQWYQSPQGALALDCTLRLTKEILSPWHRRGHCILQMGFDHAKTLELLWQSGFDVSAVCTSPSLLEHLEAPLRQCVDIQYRAPAGLDTLPYADKSFDYVVISLPPTAQEKPYPSLQSMVGEALRIAAKGILFQGWNICSLAGLHYTWKKKALPLYLQEGTWHTWRHVYSTLRALAPKGDTGARSSISTKTSLISPIPYWTGSGRFEKTHHWKLSIPLGALMQVRLTLQDQGAMTSMPLYVRPLTHKPLQTLPVVESVRPRVPTPTSRT